jgi:hypothetical protein
MADRQGRDPSRAPGQDSGLLAQERFGFLGELPEGPDVNHLGNSALLFEDVEVRK